MKHFFRSAAALACAGVLHICAARAAAETVLYSFQGGSDGAAPAASLVIQDDGNIYGTTSTDGEGGAGTIFRLAPDGKETVLYAFPGIAGGLNWNSLLLDKTGNLYGTTYNGGRGCHGAGCGTVYRLAPDGTFSTLYAFSGRRDGAKPASPVIWDAQGNLWGATNEGGGKGCHPHRGCGTIFELTPAPGGKWNESIVYSFKGGSDGAGPVGALIWSAKGELVLTTQYGGGQGCGASGCGTVFKLAKKGEKWISFPAFSFHGQSDGAFPQAGVVEDARGNLYGTTLQGGSGGPGCFEAWGCGVVFKLAPDNSETTLHAFAGGRDGGFSFAHLVVDAKGNIYGTTAEGGKKGCSGFGCGTAFKIAPDGRETLLHVFSCKSGGCTPTAGLIMDAAGNLYGATENGGGSRNGVLYRLKR